MSDYIGVVTNIGQAKIAAAIGGTALNLATIRVGDGNGAPIVPNAAMTDLVRRVGAAYPIISSGRDPVNANHWRVTALIPVNDGPFDVREIGVWDAAGDMIAIAKHVLVEKRTPAQGAAVELLTDIVFPVSETAQVTVQVAPTAQISIFQMLRAGFTVVESATLANPPAGPALGRTHVVPAGATGAWGGLAGMLVQWNGIVWVAVDAPIGFHVVDQSKGLDTGARWLERTVAGWSPGVSRLIQRQPGNFLTAAGTANALTITPDPAFMALGQLVGVPLRIQCTANNTGPATLNASGLGAVNIVDNDTGQALTGGELQTNKIVTIVSDGTVYRLLTGNRRGFHNVQVFLGSGTYTPTASHPGAKVTVVGGGGSGGSTGSSANLAGGGGGAGGAAIKWIPYLPVGVGVAVTVGLGGASVPGNAGPAGYSGNNGGTSSFGAYCSATGGQGGAASIAGNSGGGIGGIGSGGDINIRGGSGSDGQQNSQGSGGNGGNSIFGGAGRASTARSSPVQDGGAPGAGGGGAYTSVSTGSGFGADGIVIVEF